MKKFVLCISIIFIMIACTFGAGCISAEGNNGNGENKETDINNPVNNPVNNPLEDLLKTPLDKPKYSIKEIENMASSNSGDYTIYVGKHQGIYFYNVERFECMFDSRGGIYSHTVEGDFSNYKLTDDMLILSQERSLYIVKDVSIGNRFVTIIPKGEDSDNSIATILYADEEDFEYLCSFLYR